MQYMTVITACNNYLFFSYEHWHYKYVPIIASHFWTHNVWEEMINFVIILVFCFWLTALLLYCL